MCFDDTILFPEGGGQNTDHGMIVKKDLQLEVKNIFRREREAVHEIFVADLLPLSVGDEVTQIVDWDRRFDHMQQHSGQHLISAIFEQVNLKFFFIDLVNLQCILPSS